MAENGTLRRAFGALGLNAWHGEITEDVPFVPNSGWLVHDAVSQKLPDMR